MPSGGKVFKIKDCRRLKVLWAWYNINLGGGLGGGSGDGQTRIYDTLTLLKMEAFNPDKIALWILKNTDVSEELRIIYHYEWRSGSTETPDDINIIQLQNYPTQGRLEILDV